MSLLANVEHNTTNSLVSKALDNNNISDTEFKIITDSRDGKIQKNQRCPVRPTTNAADLEKIREEVREEMRKKIAAAAAALN